jgi:hypothetical protein
MTSSFGSSSLKRINWTASRYYLRNISKYLPQDSVTSKKTWILNNIASWTSILAIQYKQVQSVIWIVGGHVSNILIILRYLQSLIYYHRYLFDSETLELMSGFITQVTCYCKNNKTKLCWIKHVARTVKAMNSMGSFTWNWPHEGWKRT